MNEAPVNSVSSVIDQSSALSLSEGLAELFGSPTLKMLPVISPALSSSTVVAAET